MAEKEFYSFDEALRELRLKEEELKRLVSEGEIRAIREGEVVKLRKSDVETLRSTLQGGEVVDVGQATEEIVFEDDTELDAGMATEEISEADTILEEEPAEAAEEAEEEEEYAPVRVEEEPFEGGLAIALMCATAALLLASVPLALSLQSGYPNAFSKTVASWFN